MTAIRIRRPPTSRVLPSLVVGPRRETISAFAIRPLTPVRFPESRGEGVVFRPYRAWRILAWPVLGLAFLIVCHPHATGAAEEPAKADSPPVRTPDPQLLKERDALTSQVASLRQNGQLAEAVPAAKKLVALTRQAFGETHPQMGGALKQLAAVSAEAGDWPAAEATWKEVVQLGTRLYGESHYRVTDARLALQYVQGMARLDPADRQRLIAAGQRLPEADRLARTNQVAAALQIYLELAQRQRQLLGDKDPELAATLDRLGGLYKDLGNYDLAETCYRQAVAIKKEVRGELNPEYASSLNNLAVLYLERAEHARAAQLFEQAAEIYKRTLGERHERYAGSLSDLGMVHFELTDYAKAESLFQRALEIQQARFGERHADCAVTLNNLGLVCQQRAQYPQAEQYYQRSLEIVKALVGARHLDYARGLGNLATLYDRMGDYPRAVQLQREALDIKRAALGEGHLDYAISLDNLATTYESMGEPALAEGLFQQALTIRRKTLGPQHADCAGTLNNLASLYRAQADFARAEPLFREALDIVRKALGEKHPEYATQLNNLAGCYFARGNWVLAEPLYRQALELRKSTLGEKHPLYAASLNNLAMFYERTGDKAQAEPLLLQALKLRREALGDKHPDCAESLNNLAAFYAATNRTPQALPLYRETLQIREARLGAKHPLYAQTLHNLAAAYEALDDFSAALPLYQQASEIRRAALGAKHPECAGALNDLAVVYEELGQYGPAEKLQRQALELHRQTLGEKHPAYAANAMNLALLYFRQGNYAASEPLCRQAVEIKRQLVEDTSAVLSERQQLALAGAFRGAVDCYLSLALAAQLPGEQAYRQVLAWKGGVFARQCASRQDRDQAASRAAFEELEQVVRRLATLVFAVPAPPRLEAWSRQVAELTAQKERLEAELAGRHPEFQRLQAQRRISPQQLQAVLPAGVVLVDFLEYTRRAAPPAGAGRLLREPHLAAFVVRHDRPLVQLDLGPAPPIIEAVARWRQMLDPQLPAGAQQPSTGDPASRAFDFAHSREVSGGTTSEGPAQAVRHLLWDPLEKHLDGARIVLVSPDGVVTRCPLGALPGRQPGKYLLEEVPVALIAVPQLLPELLELAAPREPKVRAAGALLLVGAVDYAAGQQSAAAAALPTPPPSAATDDTRPRLFPPLPGTAREIDAAARISRQFRPEARVDVLSEAAATEAALRRQAPTHRYVHLATHGFFAPPQMRLAFATVLGAPPETTTALWTTGAIDRTIAGFHPGLLSGLVLAGANRGAVSDGTGTLTDDGILTASELASLDLRETDLVVLSACETGLGAVAGGEGVLGLQRAFQAAGARTVVATLWRIRDAATEALMAEFYRNLWERKLSKLESLRQAQLTILRDFDVPKGKLRQSPPSRAGPQSTAVAPDRVSPQYWAAFVLSGDWR